MSLVGARSGVLPFGQLESNGLDHRAERRERDEKCIYHFSHVCKCWARRPLECPSVPHNISLYALSCPPVRSWIASATLDHFRLAVGTKGGGGLLSAEV